MCKSFSGKNPLRICTFLLAILLLFAVTACGKEKNKEDENYNKNDEKYDMVNFSELSDDEDSYFHATEVFLHKSKEFQRIYARGAAVNQDMFATVISTSMEIPENGEYTEQEYEEYQQYLCTFDTNGDLKNKTNIQDIADEPFSYVGSVALSKTNEIYMLMYPPMEVLEKQNQVWLYHLDENSKPLGEKTIIQLEASGYNPDIYVDMRGNIYITGYNEQSFLQVLSPTGKELFTVQGKHEEFGSLIFGSSCFSDGNQVYINANIANGSTLIFPVDLEKKSIGSPIGPAFMVNGLDAFQSGIGQIMHTSDRGVYRINPETGEQKIALLWENQNVYTLETMKEVYMLSEDLLLLQQTPGMSMNSYEMPDTHFFLMKRTENPNTEKSVIRIGGYGISNNSFLQKAVFAFNQTQNDKRVVIEDYKTDEVSGTGKVQKVIESDEGIVYIGEPEEKEYSDRLRLDLLSGNAPDILYGISNDFSEFIAPETFENLHTFIENDSDFNIEDYYTNILNLDSSEAKLYNMNLSFSLRGLASAKSVTGERDFWTFDDFEDFTASVQEDKKIFADVSQSMLLYYYAMSSWDELLDERTMKASLDSPDFKKVLDFAKKYGITAEEDEQKMLRIFETDFYQAVLSGEFVFMEVHISHLAEFMEYIGAFGESAVFTGYPANIEKGIPFSTSASVSIPKGAENQDDAWEFICFLLSEEMQMNLDNAFPVRKSAMEKKLEKNIQPELMMGGSLGTKLSDVPLQPLTGEHIRVFRDLIARADTECTIDDRIMDIIIEEAAGFFAGQKTTDDVTKIMQSRVQTLLDERA